MLYLNPDLIPGLHPGPVPHRVDVLYESIRRPNMAGGPMSATMGSMRAGAGDRELGGGSGGRMMRGDSRAYLAEKPTQYDDVAYYEGR